MTEIIYIYIGIFGSEFNLNFVFGNLMDGNPKVIHNRMTNKSGINGKTASHYVMLEFEENKRLTVIQFLNVAVYCMFEAVIKLLICQSGDAETRQQNYWLMGTWVQF